MTRKPSRELVVGAVVRHKGILQAQRYGDISKDSNSKGIVMDVREAPVENPTWGRSYRIVRLQHDKQQPGTFTAESHWDGAHDLEVLGRVKRLPRSDRSRWGRLSTTDKLSLAPGNRVRIAGTQLCGTVVSVSRTDYMAPGHRAVVAFDDGVEEEFFHGLAPDGRRLVRGGCGPDLIDPLTIYTYQSIESSEHGEQDRQRARELHREMQPRARCLRYMSHPHAQCERAGHCVEHEAIPTVPPCEYGAVRGGS